MLCKDMPVFYPRVSSSSKSSSGAMWKCAFCGAMNEEENLVCDGCGDERPMSPQTAGSKLDKRQDFEDMGRAPAPPSPSAPSLDNDDEEIDENIEVKDDQDNDEP